MIVRLRMYKYCYSNLGAIYAKGLFLGELVIKNKKTLSKTFKEL